MNLDKPKLYDELKEVYLFNNIDADVIIIDLCNFFDSNILNDFLEFIKEERGI